MLARQRLMKYLLIRPVLRKLITPFSYGRLSDFYPLKVIQRLGQYTHKSVEDMYLEILASELGNPPCLEAPPGILSGSSGDRWHWETAASELAHDDITEDFDRLVAWDLLVDGAYGVFAKFGKIAADRSLVVREPYLDNPLVDFVNRLPEKYKVRGSLWQRLKFSAETKHLMRRGLADKMLPPETLSKTKAGFTPPMVGWLREYFGRSHIGAEALLGKTLKGSGILDIKFIDEIIKEFRGGSRPESNPLYMLLLLAVWHRIYIENYDASAPSMTLTELLSG
jgi:hypothetical protein